MSEIRLPAEWESHDATWLTWPTAVTTWPASILKSVQDSYIDLIETLLAGEVVELFVDNALAKGEVVDQLKTRDCDLGNLIIHIKPTNDAWIRDYGADFILKDREKFVIDWDFNAWGGKYEPYEEDNYISSYMVKQRPYKYEMRDEILEGGSFDTNGKGLFLTTESCLLNDNRNSFTKEEAEKLFKEVLGAKEFIWLKEGIVGDDTDGHIDDITRFVNVNTIAFATESDKSDANYQILKANEEKLKEYRDMHFPELELIPIPMPAPVVFDNERLPASYLNFYISNAAVIVPTFDDPNDAKALAIFSEVFSDRRVIGMHASHIVVGLGSFHCLTKHECKAPVDN